VFALNAGTGSIIWSFNRGGGLPILKNNQVYVNSDSLYALDAVTGIKKWGYYANENPSVPPVVFADRIYVLSYNYTLSALNTATGTEIWKKPSFYLTVGQVEDCEGLNVKNGNIYAATNHLIILDSATGTIKYTATARPHTYSGQLEYGDGIAPVVTDSLVFVLRSRLDIFDAFTGQFKWTLPTAGGSNFGVTVVGNIVYYTSALSDVVLPGGGTYKAGFVYAYDLKSRQLKWQAECKDIDFTGPSPCAITPQGKSYRGGISN
jgi:outer membrane protein assembly factor BamB